MEFLPFACVFLQINKKACPKKNARLFSIVLCGGQTLDSASFNLDEFYFLTSFWDSKVPQVIIYSKNVQFKKVFSGAVHCWANDSLTATTLLLQTASGIALVLHPTDQEHELFSMNCVRIKIK